MIKKQLLFLFLLCFAFFAPYFAKEYMVEPDSYYFLAPETNIYAAKALLFVCLCVSVAFVSILGYIFNKKDGWLAGIFVFLSPIFLLEYLKFEPETFAYPILFASLVFFFKNGWKNKTIACCLVFSATFIWQGSFLYFIPMVFSFIPALLPLGFGFWLIKFNPLLVLGNFLPKAGVQESAFLGSGITFHWALLAGFAGLDRKLFKLLPFVVFFSILAFLNAKFAIHIAPLLAVAIPNLLKFDRFKPLLFGVLVAILCCSPIAVTQFYSPTDSEITQVKLAVQEANGEIIYNDWGFGHVINYFGGKALAKAGGKQPDLNCTGCVVLTNSEINCEKLNGLKPFVYRC
jgi:hypothetical protein